MRWLCICLCFLAAASLASAVFPQRSFVASFGSDNDGRLGRASNAKFGEVALNCPRKICAIRDLAVTGSYGVVKSAWGTYIWGSNATGEFGDAKSPYPGAPTSVPHVFSGKSVAASSSLSIVALEGAWIAYNGNASELTGFGADTEYQLGLVGWAKEAGVTTVNPSVLTVTAVKRVGPITSTPFSIAPSSVSTSFLPVDGTMTCADTRCYYQEGTDNFWRYWGAAPDYDPSYSPSTASLNIVSLPGTQNVQWVVANKNAMLQLVTGGPPKLFGVGLFLDGTPNSIAGNMTDPILLNTSCAPVVNADRLRASLGDTFAIYACVNRQNIYAFGNNTLLQLGNGDYTNSYYSGTGAHVRVNITLDPSEYFVAIATGMSTGYAFTSFNNTWAWGYSGSNAMGSMNFPFNYAPYPVRPFQFADNPSYQVADVRSVSTAHGLFLILKKRPGVCNDMPIAMKLLVGQTFCDYDGFVNIEDTMEMNHTMAGSLTSYMKMRGDMVMKGSSQMQSIVGMSVEGNIELHDEVQVMLAGPGSIVGTFSAGDNAIVNFTSANVSIEGTLDFGPSSHLAFSGMSATFDGSTALLTLDGNATINGTISLTYTQQEIDQIVAALLAAHAKREAELDFSAPDASNSTGGNYTLTQNTTIVTSKSGSFNAASASVSVTLAQPSDSCNQIEARTSATPSGLTTVFTLTGSSSCTPSSNNGAPGSPSTNNTKKQQNIAIIIGPAVAGGVVVLFVIAAIVILTVAPLRNAVLPYRDAGAKRRVTSYQPTRDV